VLDDNIDVIEGLTRRGKRMLSIVDLVKLKMIPLELAAYLIDGMQNGASVLIGARPSGAGKTTMMGALAGVIPSSERIITIEGARHVPHLLPGTIDEPITYIIHEIGRSRQYLWGSSVVDTTRLVDSNTRLIANLHAEKMDDIKATFSRFGSENAFHVFDFVIFIRHDRRNPPRVVNEVYEFDRLIQSYKRIYSQVEEFSKLNLKDNQRQKKWEKFLSMCLDQEILHIGKVAYAFARNKPIVN